MVSFEEDERTVIESLVERLARFMAILGGTILTALILVVCLSVSGRLLNGIIHNYVEPLSPALSKRLLDSGVGPINGDFELVEAGIAFAIFAFLPLCQITRSHASVDILSAFLPRRLNSVIAVVIDITFAAVLILIAVQLYSGMLSKMRYGETTFLLQFPVWWGYAASLVGAAIAALVAVYVAISSISEEITGKAVLPSNPESDK